MDDFDQNGGRGPVGGSGSGDDFPGAPGNEGFSFTTNVAPS